MEICWVFTVDRDSLSKSVTFWKMDIGPVFLLAQYSGTQFCFAVIGHFLIPLPRPNCILHTKRLWKIHSFWESPKLVWQTYIFTNWCLTNLVSYFLQYCVHILAWGGGSQAQEVYGWRVITHYYIYTVIRVIVYEIWSSFCLVRRTGWTLKQHLSLSGAFKKRYPDEAGYLKKEIMKVFCLGI